MTKRFEALKAGFRSAEYQALKSYAGSSEEGILPEPPCLGMGQPKSKKQWERDIMAWRKRDKAALQGYWSQGDREEAPAGRRSGRSKLN